MAFQHGKDTVLVGGDTAWTGQLNQFTATRNQQVVATTPFGSTDQQFIAGQYEGGMSIGGMFEAATIDADLEGLIGSSAPITVAFGGDTVGNRAFLFNGFLDDYGIQGAVNDAVRVNATFGSSGAVRLGVSLHDLSAETSTMNEASVDQAASSSNGAVANLHVTAFNGTNVVIKVQDSANDADWADLITFSTVSGVTSERATVTGSVDRYVRAVVASGTFTSVTFAVSFARNWN